MKNYLSNFDYAERKAMKITSEELVSLLQEGEAQLIDIRFKEEFAAWHMGIAHNIPLNELPDRLDEIDKDKIVVTACPHKDRAILGRLFLTLNGYQAKYLVDGLIGMADTLRGDKARLFIEQTQQVKA
ncbi:MAG TPA: rhodanese-like domain-containing protein [Crenotrichaceae bacterium]|nr:rhodanese-like domain-containing protein [Crenotrichaceae bacterium]